MSLVPGNGPYAASAYIRIPGGLVLGVSRKYDPNDFGLPGGKLDPGEDFRDAVIRETKEETGLTIVRLVPIFGEYCGKPEKNVVHWALTFICEAEGELYTQEKGRPMWMPHQRLIEGPGGFRCSFADYNEALLKAVENLGRHAYVSKNIRIDPKDILRE